MSGPSSSDDHHLRELVSEGAPPPIVMVPGIDGTALLFYRQTPLLSRHFDVVSFPLPDSPNATMDDLVADLSGLIQEVSAQGAILVGESFGGALSLSTALDRPDLVKGLVILNSFPWANQRLKLAVAPWVMRAVPWAAMPMMRRFTESRIHSEHTLPEDLSEFHERARQIGRAGYIRRLEIIRSYDIRSRLHEIQPPSLFLAADQDQLVPSTMWANYMNDRVPNSEMVTLNGYGHVCMITHDFDLTRYIVPWWERHSSTSHVHCN